MIQSMILFIQRFIFFAHKFTIWHKFIYDIPWRTFWNLQRGKSTILAEWMNDLDNAVRVETIFSSVPVIWPLKAVVFYRFLKSALNYRHVVALDSLWAKALHYTTFWNFHHFLSSFFMFFKKNDCRILDYKSVSIFVACIVAFKFSKLIVVTFDDVLTPWRLINWNCSLNDNVAIHESI